MSCIRTGCQVYLVEYGEYLWCDAFEFGDQFIFRAVSRERQPTNPRLHFTITHISHWFDKDKTNGNQASTIVAHKINSAYHSYEGKPIQLKKVD